MPRKLALKQLIVAQSLPLAVHVSDTTTTVVSSYLHEDVPGELDRSSRTMNRNNNNNDNNEVAQSVDVVISLLYCPPHSSNNNQGNTNWLLWLSHHRSKRQYNALDMLELTRVDMLQVELLSAQGCYRPASGCETPCCCQRCDSCKPQLYSNEACLALGRHSLPRSLEMRKRGTIR